MKRELTVPHRPSRVFIVPEQHPFGRARSVFAPPRLGGHSVRGRAETSGGGPAHRPRMTAAKSQQKRKPAKATAVKASADTGARRVGDLSIFGITKLWRVPTILPKRFRDLRHPHVDFSRVEAGTWACVGGVPSEVALVSTAVAEEEPEELAPSESIQVDDTSEIVDGSVTEEVAPDPDPSEGEAVTANASAGAAETWAVVLSDIDRRQTIRAAVQVETKAHKAAIERAIAGKAIWLFGYVVGDDGSLVLNDAEPVDESDLGEVHAYYPSKSKRELKVPPGARRSKGRPPQKRWCLTKITSAQTGILVRDKNRLAISPCAKTIRERMHLENDAPSEWDLMRVLGSPGPTIETTLKLAHRPPDIDTGEAAVRALEYLCALELVQHIIAERDKTPNKERRVRIAARQFRECVDQVEKSLGTKLTDEQRFGAAEILADIAGPKRTHRLLSGDVGSGKTAVFLIPSACLAYAGHLVVVISPGADLARQLFGAVQAFFPDLPAQLIAGNVKEPLSISSGILVGTTAVWSRIAAAEISPILVVADEQQKFGVDQRMPWEHSKCNMLESTATAIPRSQALIQFGGMPVTRLHYCHVKKDISTRVVQGLAPLELAYDEIAARIEDQACNLILVFPVIDSEPQEKAPRRRVEKAVRVEEEPPAADVPLSVREAVDAWEARFPSAVGLIHGRLSHDQRQQVLAGFRDGALKVLIATSIVEVGIDLPKADQMVIHHPERFGTSAIHQLRGRLARKGGRGWCVLATRTTITEEQLAMLTLFETEYNGFALSAADMVRRGFGDIRRFSNQQSGAYNGLLVDRPPSVADVDWVVANCERWLSPEGGRDLVNDAIALTETMAGFSDASSRPRARPKEAQASDDSSTRQASQLDLFASS